MPEKQPTEISLVELKAVLDRLFEHVIKTRGVRTIEMAKDFYWQVPHESLFDMSLDASNIELNVGSLYDDWEFVKSALDLNGPVLASQLGEVSALLRFIGEMLAQKLASRGG